MTEEVKQEIKKESSKVDDILLGRKDEVKESKDPVNDEYEVDVEPPPIAAQEKSVEQDEKSTSSELQSSDVDEFGNPLVKEKPRVYTEEEVNRMMRERFNRTQIAKQEEMKQQQPQEGDEGWQDQLKNYVKETLHELTEEEKRHAQELQERQILKEFEDKFARGMTRYNDFETVVRGKPIDDTMMMATRSMKDPAAFIYAASKSYPKELERIASITDPYYKVAEIGRLEERMRKARASTSSPRPIQQVQGDIENKQNYRQSVDDLILKDAQKKFQQKRF